MTRTPSLLDTMHDATHRIPGVPAHEERAAGHQGRTDHGHGNGNGHGRAHQGRSLPAGDLNHTEARPPRVLVAWQQKIAALFGQGR